jgi:predicted kinase
MANRLCLCGVAGAGKSALARVLARDYGYEVVKFADPLKEMLRVLGLGDQELEGDRKGVPSDLLCGHTPRWAMQRLGTEWGRMKIGESLWVDAWRRRIEALPADTKIVADDCRFPNELAAARTLGFVPVRIRRSGSGCPEDRHFSEYALDEVWMPEFLNDGAPEALALNILGLYEY